VTAPLADVHLADTSAWAKARNDATLSTWFEAAVRDLTIATCDVVALELQRSASSVERFRRQGELLALLPTCTVGADELRRARDVQAQLASKGHHRGVKPIDLVIAAAAEAAELPVLHYDHDFDLIAEVTGQAVRWLAPRGSLP
jgi:predicted nucleic acid-binding protein